MATGYLSTAGERGRTLDGHDRNASLEYIVSNMRDMRGGAPPQLRWARVDYLVTHVESLRPGLFQQPSALEHELRVEQVGELLQVAAERMSLKRGYSKTAVDPRIDVISLIIEGLTTGRASEGDFGWVAPWVDANCSLKGEYPKYSFLSPTRQRTPRHVLTKMGAKGLSRRYMYVTSNEGTSPLRHAFFDQFSRIGAYIMFHGYSDVNIFECELTMSYHTKVCTMAVSVDSASPDLIEVVNGEFTCETATVGLMDPLDSEAITVYKDVPIRVLAKTPESRTRIIEFPLRVSSGDLLSSLTFRCEREFHNLIRVWMVLFKTLEVSVDNVYHLVMPLGVEAHDSLSAHGPPLYVRLYKRADLSTFTFRNSFNIVIKEMARDAQVVMNPIERSRLVRVLVVISLDTANSYNVLDEKYESFSNIDLQRLAMSITCNFKPGLMSGRVSSMVRQPGRVDPFVRALCEARLMIMLIFAEFMRETIITRDHGRGGANTIRSTFATDFSERHQDFVDQFLDNIVNGY